MRLLKALALAALLLSTPLSLAAQQFNLRAVISTAASGDSTLVAASSGKSINVYAIDLVPASSVVATLKCGSSTAITGAMTIATPFIKPLTASPAYWVCPVGTALVLNLGTGIQVSGAVWYSQQ